VSERGIFFVDLKRRPRERGMGRESWRRVGEAGAENEGRLAL